MSMSDNKTDQLSNEIASRAKITPHLGTDLGAIMSALPNPDPILKKLGCDIAVYRDIMVDPVIKGAIRRRRAAVVGLEYGLEQGDASDKVMALCQQTLSRIKLRSLIRELHDAAWWGYSPAEIYWVKEHGQWLPQRVVGKPAEWFGFDSANQLCFKSAHTMVFEPVPDMKFIMTRNDASFVNPYGVADMAAVYWYAIFRKGGLKFWLRFADKYGQAFIIGKHPRGTPQAEVDGILDSLEVLSQDGIGAIPNDGAVEIMESGGKGATADLFERLLTYCSSEINIALLGQDQTTNASSTNASAQAGLEVTDDIRDADGEMVAEAINELLRYVVSLNIGDDETMPVWSMWSDEDVTEALASRDEKLQKAGARLTKPYFMRAYKLGEDEVEVDAPLQGDARQRTDRTRTDDGAQNSGVKADFSEQDFNPVRPERLDYADSNVAKMAAGSQPAINDWLTRLQRVIARAPSLEVLPDMLADAFSELPTDALVEVIALGMTAANLAGRAEVDAEVAYE